MIPISEIEKIITELEEDIKSSIVEQQEIMLTDFYSQGYFDGMRKRSEQCAERLKELLPK